MAQDIRLMWPSTYDPITNMHTVCVGKGINRKMYAFTSEEWENYTYVNSCFKEETMARHSKYTAEAARLKPKTSGVKDYSLDWVDPRGLSYLSSEAERKAADEKIRKEYDDLFDSSSYTAGIRSVTWDEYAATKGELAMNPFLDKVVKMEYVGSRITCNPPPKDTDEDVLLLTDDLETLVGDCIEVGFRRDSDIKSSYPKSFVSLRNRTLNFIVTDDEEFFDKFMLATSVCKSLNLLEKQNRITVFQAILYGKEHQSVADTPF